MFDVTTLVETLGLIGIAFFLFAESGILLGFFLPGDPLLFAAGIFAQAHFFSLPVLLVVAVVAAFLGDQFGYWMGSTFGTKVFSRPGSRYLSPLHIARAHSFYKKHGKLTVVIARFVPIVRTLVPTIAGVGKMEYRTFVTYNLIGGIIWVVGVTLFGYFLGSLIPNINTYLPIVFIAVIVLSSFVPALLRFFTRNKTKSHI